MNRYKSLAAALVAFTTLMVACTAKDRADDTGSTITVAYCCGKEALNPAHDMDAKFLVFLPLLTRNPAGELEGRLAKRWNHSPDYRDWTYHLRTDVYWHDGAPFTARDIAFTVEAMRNFDDLDYGLGAIQSVTVHDDSTVVIRAGHSRTYQTGMVFYPKHLLERLDPAQLAAWDFWTRPVGNGPYRFVRYVPEIVMEFEANPDYFAGKPRINRVNLRFSKDAGLVELLSGNVDAITDVNLAHVPRVAHDPRFSIYHHIWPQAVTAVYWKNDHRLFKDPRVRRALTLAIDRREILRLFNLPDTLPLLDGPLTPRQLWRGQFPPALPYDPPEARRLLEEAGWRDSDGDGVRERDGHRFRFTLLARSISSQNTPGNQETAVYLQSKLRGIGVQMEILTLDASAVHSRLENGNFEALITWFRYYEAAWLARFHLGTGPPIGYRNPRLAELREEAGRTFDPNVEDRIYRELMEIFRADLPVTFLHPNVRISFAHRRVRGLSSPWRTDPVAHMEELWLEDGRQH